MAKETENAKSSLLETFEFDNDNEFFGVPVEKDDKPLNIKEVKSDSINTDKKEEATSIKEVKSDDEDNELEDEKFFEEPKESKKKKVEFIEDDDDDSEIEKPDNKKKKPVTTKKPEALSEIETPEDEEDGKTDNNKEEEDKKEEDDKFYTTLALELKEKGILESAEIPKDKDLTEDEFFELQEKEIEARVDETFQAFFEELDEDARRFLKHKKNGGTTHDFLATYAASDIGIEEFDENDKAQVNRVLNYYLTTVEELDGDELEDRMKYITEGGKTKITAAKFFNKIKETEKLEREALEKAVEKASIKKQENAKAFNTELANVAKETETVGDFTIPKAEIPKLIQSIIKPTVKVGKNKYTPSFQNKLSKILNAGTAEDKQRLLLLAKLVDDDFKVGDNFKTKKKTEVTKEIRSKLKEAKTQPKTHSSGSQNKRQLSDFFSGVD